MSRPRRGRGKPSVFPPLTPNPLSRRSRRTTLFFMSSRRTDPRDSSPADRIPPRWRHLSSFTHTRPLSSCRRKNRPRAFPSLAPPPVPVTQTPLVPTRCPLRAFPLHVLHVSFCNGPLLHAGEVSPILGQMTRNISRLHVDNLQRLTFPCFDRG